MSGSDHNRNLVYLNSQLAGGARADAERFAAFRPTLAPKITDVGAAPPKPARAAGPSISVTVKLDQATYEKLKIYGIKTRQSNQHIVFNALIAALNAYGTES